MTAASLPTITALARAGAVARAWTLLADGGYLERGDDPAALAVKGRLYKDRARLADADEKAGLFAAAAQAYGQAHELAPAPYLAINAATARLLAGDPSGAAERAQGVMAMLNAPDPHADTRYFLAATRAEAALLLGDEAEAERAMAEAARCDPDGWDDRTVTLSQLRAIGAQQGRPLTWLEAFDPPPSIHFAGHMGLASSGVSEALLASELDALLEIHRPGFAWGALAAGSDIVIAERLLAAGCQLHAVLPCPPALFEAQSVAPAGEAWLARYRAVLAEAVSLRVAGPGASSVHDPIATSHAGELAIGGALLNARRLGSRAFQLIVLDENSGGTNTLRQASLWSGETGRQLLVTIPRDSAVEANFPREQPDPARALAVHVVIGLDELEPGRIVSSNEIEPIFAALGAPLAALDPPAVRAVPAGWELTLGDLDQALTTIAALLAVARSAGIAQPAIGASLAIASLHRDPASAALVPYGPGLALARRLCAMAPSGMALASDALAVTLATRASRPLHSELYHHGEPELGGAVHALV